MGPPAISLELDKSLQRMLFSATGSLFVTFAVKKQRPKSQLDTAKTSYVSRSCVGPDRV